MNKLNKIALLTATLVIALVGIALGSQPTELRPLQCDIEAVSVPEKSGLAELRLSVPQPWGCNCDSVRLTITTEGGLGYSGPDYIAVERIDPFEYSTVIEVDIPSGDTTVLHVEGICGRMSLTAGYTFISTGKKLRHLGGTLPPPVARPMSAADRYWAPFGIREDMELRKSDLSEEQLQSIHTVVLWLFTSEQRHQADSLLGPILKSAAVPDLPYAFILDISLDHLIQLSANGAEYDPTPEFREQLKKKDF